MKYSVITPVFNSEKYLRECIESVIAQTYSDWELILIDDGSSDESPRICDEYANKDSRIKVFHLPNGGAYKARLFANDFIEGDYVVGLDSDDMYEPNCLEVIEKARERSKADMIVFGRKDLLMDTNILSIEKLKYESQKVYSKEEFLAKSLLLTDHSLGNKAIKREVYKNAVYIKEEYRLSVSLDFLQVVPLLCGIDSAYVVDSNLYIYRLRSGSVSHNIKLAHLVDNDWINNSIRKYLKSKGLYLDDVRYALEHSYVDTMLPRLFTLRWMITQKDRSIIKHMPFLNSMINPYSQLGGNIAHIKVLNYIKNGFMGPKCIFYKLYLKYYIKPLSKMQRNTL